MPATLDKEKSEKEQAAKSSTKEEMEERLSPASHLCGKH